MLTVPSSTAPPVFQCAAVHAAHITACIAAVQLTVELAAPGHNIVAVNVVGKFFV